MPPITGALIRIQNHQYGRPVLSTCTIIASWMTHISFASTASGDQSDASEASNSSMGQGAGRLTRRLYPAREERFEIRFGRFARDHRHFDLRETRFFQERMQRALLETEPHI